MQRVTDVSVLTLTRSGDQRVTSVMTLTQSGDQRVTSVLTLTRSGDHTACHQCISSDTDAVG